MIVRRSVKITTALIGLVAGVALAAWAIYRYWPPRPPAVSHRGMPKPDIATGRLVVRVPQSQVIGELARYDDELFAYMMFNYLRSQPAFDGINLILTYDFAGGTIVYSIRAVPPNDIIRGCDQVYKSASGFPFLSPVCLVLPDSVVVAEKLHTDTLVRAYNYPGYHKMEQLSHSDMIAYTRRFIRFKSNTDPRILRRIEPVPHPLTREEAQNLAEDIVTVANFYSLPLDFFLGIGAMENNYMNVKGDLGHAVWKRRASRGDAIVQRRAGRVLVLDEAIGMWQITRETLRYAHRLFLRDRRDYSVLPERLRPAKTLNTDALDASVLTTYAGLLFRNLLDRFGGNINKAVGAYNGGPRNPNLRYAGGVERVAEHARKVMEAAAYIRTQRSLVGESTTPADHGNGMDRKTNRKSEEGRLE